MLLKNPLTVHDLRADCLVLGNQSKISTNMENTEGPTFPLKRR